MKKQDLKGWVEDMPLKRRDFLSLCAAGSLPIMFGGCLSQPDTAASGSPSVITRSPVTKTPNATPAPVLNEAAWTNFSKSLQGTLIRPSSAQYGTSLLLYHTQFTTRPAALAYCASPKDVQTSLNFVSKYNVAIAARSGGHSYAGYSTTRGLVLDVSRMNAVTIDAGSGNATIGSGAKLVDVYAALTQRNRILPAGSCPTVGIAGLAMGGGIGVLGRKFGLTSDNLLSAQVVLANGQIVSCDSNHHADLFWALRGGGGGNFGIVTSFTFRTYPAPALTRFTLTWPWSSVAAVVNAWQNWAPSAPDELWSGCVLLTNVDKSSGPIIEINGVYVGSASALNPLLQHLKDSIGTQPASSYVTADSVLNIMLYEAGCYNKTVAACHLPSQNPQGQVKRDTSQARSDFFTTRLPARGIDALINAINQSQASSVPGGSGIGFDASGGAINRVAKDATAFVHRDALFSIQYTGSWEADASASAIAANLSWLKNTWQAMRPYASGSAYQNYIDPDLSNWQQAYYGGNLARLKQVKKSYDPGNLFHFKQSIPLT